ncbi:MAG: TonB-dependent receptor family protein [Bacteroidia bacterium]|nr:TonB-dependent receptor family protein [Bacteroidia bacterium]
MRNSLVYIFVCFCALHTAAQTGPAGILLKGQIKTPDNQPAEMAVVTLLAATDSSLVKGDIADATGAYALDAIQPGNYVLTVSLTGYAKYWLAPVELSSTITEKTLPLITLTPAADLGPVTVTAIQPLFVAKPDMLIMNVENSPVKMSGTVYELIQKVPGVIADQNGNISLKGRAGVQVHIDGKPTYLAGDQLRQYLEAMPAAEVIRVEIISNPSARYDAQGSAGILNIVTKTGSKQGFNGRARMSGGYGRRAKAGAGISMNYGMPKANIYTRYDFSNWNSLSFYDSRKLIAYNGEEHTFNGFSDNDNSNFSHSFTLGADFNPNKRTSFGFQARGSLFTAENETSSLIDIAQLVQDSAFRLNQVNNTFDDHQNLRGGIWFKHLFDTLGRELSVSGDAIYHNYNGDGDYDSRYLNHNDIPIASPFIQRHFTVMQMNIYVGQIDYVHPINEKYKLEAGVKSSAVKIDNSLVFDILQNNAWQKDTTRSNDFIYTENIQAAYSQFYSDWGKVQLQLGLRYEYTRADGNSPTINQRQIRRYGNFFPSIFLTHVMNEKHTITYSLTRRINRPNYDDLNPFRMYLDQYTYRVGNPFLQPEISWNAEISHSFSEFLFTSVGGSRSFDGISEASDQNDSLLTTILTTSNLDNIDNFYVSLSGGIPVAKFWTMEASVTYNWFEFQSRLFGGILNTQTSTWNFNLQNTLMLPFGVKLQISGTLSTPIEYGIYSVKTRGGVNAGLSKSFLKNKLSVTVNANDIFVTNYPRVDINYMNQNSYLASRYENNYVLARINWTFGNEKAARRAQYKGTADEILQRGGL